MKKGNKGISRFIRLCAVAAGLTAVVALAPQNTLSSRAAEPLTVTEMQDVAIIIGSQGSGSDTTESGGGAESSGGSEETTQQEAGSTDQTADSEASAESSGGETVVSVKVTKDTVNVRSAASTSSDKAGSVKKDEVLEVTGQETDGDGNIWYAITFSGGSGYVRSDMVEVNETAAPEPAPEEVPEQVPEEQPAETVNNDYSLSYEDDGTGAGTSAWYLNDNLTGGKYELTSLLAGQSTGDEAEGTDMAASVNVLTIILGVLVVVLLVVIAVLIFKLRSNRYDDDYDEDDDEEDDEDEEDDDDEDEEDDDEEDDEEEYPRRRRFGRKPQRKSSGRSRYDEDEDDDDDEDEDEEETYIPVRKSRTPAKENRKSEKASAREKDWQSKNFMDDDDMDFEFLDFK